MKSELALALLVKRWENWQKVVHKQLPYQRQAERLRFIKLYLLYKKIKEENVKKNLANQNKTSIFKRSSTTAGLLHEEKIKKHRLKNCDDDYPLIVYEKPISHSNYFDHIKMDVEIYYELLNLVKYKLKKKTWIRTAVPPHIRLQICLRYLASGDSMLKFSNEFKLCSNKVSNIIIDTCEVITDVLKNSVLPTTSKYIWKKKAKEFECQFDFPYCMGAIGGKQIIYQAPFYNEIGKERGSLTFFGIVDVDCRFTTLSIGLENMINNGIVFSETQVGRDLRLNSYNFPTINKKYPDVPYVIVGNKNFPLTKNLLKPYEHSKTMDLSEQIFNCKVERVNQCASHAVDILTSQWKIFRKKFATSTSNTSKIVKAIVCLHNFIMEKEIQLPLQDRKYAVVVDKEHIINGYLQGHVDINFHPEETIDEAVLLRNKFKQLFCKVESITLLDWQRNLNNR